MKLQRFSLFGLGLLGALLLLSFNNCTSNFQTLGSNNSKGLSSTGSALDGQPAPVGQPPADTNAPILPPNFSPQAIQVCPIGCQFSLPSLAFSAAKNGSLIEIMSGDYLDCISIRLSQMTIRGVGASRPHLHSKICDGKGIIVNYGTQNRIENIELSDFTNIDFNAAAIRQDVAAKDVILSNLFIHNGQMGILGGSTGDHVSVDHLTSKDVGVLRPDGEISVPIFISAGASLQVRASNFTNAVGGASFIKARTAELVVDCSTIANLESDDSYNIDYQTGGNFSLFNSVIEQSSRSLNSNMVAINSVSYDPSIGNSMTLLGNVFLNDANTGSMIAIFKQMPPTMKVENNIFVGSSNIFSNAYSFSLSNQSLAARPANFGAYPKLPDPLKCLTLAPTF